MRKPWRTCQTEEQKENLEKVAAEDLAVLLIGGDGYSFGKKVEVWSPYNSCNKQLPDLPDYRTSHDSAGLDGVPVVCGGERTLQSCLQMNTNQYWETFCAQIVGNMLERVFFEPVIPSTCQFSSIRVVWSATFLLPSLPVSHRRPKSRGS